MPKTPNPRNLTNPIQFKVSISEKLKQQLAEAAKRSGNRSITAEIVHRLEHSFRLRLASEVDPRTREVAEAFIEKAFEFLQEVEETAVINRLHNNQTVPEIVSTLIDAMADWDKAVRKQKEELKKEVAQRIAGREQPHSKKNK